MCPCSPLWTLGAQRPTIAFASASTFSRSRGEHLLTTPPPPAWWRGNANHDAQSSTRVGCAALHEKGQPDSSAPSSSNNGTPPASSPLHALKSTCALLRFSVARRGACTQTQKRRDLARVLCPRVARPVNATRACQPRKPASSPQIHPKTFAQPPLCSLASSSAVCIARETRMH